MNDPLSQKEAAALAALMATDTIAAAAEAAGVDERTIRRYLDRPAFKAALREAQMAVVLHSTVALAGACSGAVEALKSVMDDLDAPHAAMVSAARTILTLANEAIVDADQVARIEALEQAGGAK